MGILRRFIWFLVASGLLLPGLSHAQSSGQAILVKNPWVRAMPPSAENTAAYMTIETHTAEDLILQSASTTVAQVVEFHRMKQVGDIMEMKEVDSLRIPAGGSLVLKPDGYHLMIIHLHRPLREGETIPLVLDFAGGHRITVNAIVHK